MFSPKYKKKIIHRENRQTLSRAFPSQWADFAPLCKIRGGSGIEPFTPYEYQKQLINFIHKTPTTVITKTRQLGFTEAIANYFLWKACLNPAYLGVIFSKSQSDTSNIAKRVRRHLESLNLKTRTNALTDIELVAGGRILFRNSTPSGARGLEAVHDILYDEAAFVKEIEEIYKSSMPCTTVLGDRARIIILSTPNGQSGWYWDKLNSHNRDKDLLQICLSISEKEIEPVQYWRDEYDTGKFLCHWYAHPEFSLKDNYLDGIKRKFQISEAALQQEYNLSFSEGEQIVFDPAMVRECALGTWEEAQSDGIYFFGIDTTLYGSDYCVVVVLREMPSNTYKLVSLYRDRKKTNQIHIYEIGNLIQQYKPIKVGIEVNSGGRIYYENLSSEFLNTEFVQIKTTASSKPAMVTKLVLALESRSLIYPNDPRIINEFLSFRDNDGLLEAVNGQHDDIIMSLAFAMAII
jgi:hypothetical protein